LAIQAPLIPTVNSAKGRMQHDDAAAALRPPPTLVIRSDFSGAVRVLRATRGSEVRSITYDPARRP